MRIVSYDAIDDVSNDANDDVSNGGSNGVSNVERNLLQCARGVISVIRVHWDRVKLRSSLHCFRA